MLISYIKTAQKLTLLSYSIKRFYFDTFTLKLWISGGILGYIAVVKNIAGIPFVDSSFFIRYPQMTPPIMGALVYGAMGGAFGALGGKPW